MTTPTTIAVVGAGAMGRGIIESAVVRGLTVHVFEPAEAARKNAVERIERSIGKAIKRGKVELSDAAEAMNRISWFDSLAFAATNGPAPGLEWEMRRLAVVIMTKCQAAPRDHL